MASKYNSRGLIDGVSGMLVATFSIKTEVNQFSGHGRVVGFYVVSSDEVSRANFSNISSQRHLILNKCRDMAIVTHANRFSLFGRTGLIRSQSVTLKRYHVRYMASVDYKVKSFERRGVRYLSVRNKGRFVSVKKFERLGSSDVELVELSGISQVRLPNRLS